MNDGTRVAIDPTQPLPQAVADERVADARAGWYGDFMETLANAGSFVRETGKPSPRRRIFARGASHA